MTPNITHAQLTQVKKKSNKDTFSTQMTRQPRFMKKTIEQ